MFREHLEHMYAYQIALDNNLLSSDYIMSEIAKQLLSAMDIILYSGQLDEEYKDSLSKLINKSRKLVKEIED